ncbi:DMT family transporter [Herbiconiux flava]|uniref:Drug/metabolite transporter (DMT)-like permease n=1 Tax=Herbiconiux flava TaxID=881268 RepID=A0A852S9S1_9MICO|nr:DMT family transporter [Herbiconiux flava]NYD69092.1 drug/metabolite transporter (DMT)-like permease [Herbiconiux flava]GLK15840.1 membrane protein [Herbiconiux flava]
MKADDSATPPPLTLLPDARGARPATSTPGADPAARPATVTPTADPAPRRGGGRPSLAPGLVWGFLGVLAFSFTLPFTRVAVATLDPLFVGAGRAVVAALLAAMVLLATRSRPPARRLWPRIAVVAAGVVVGFPFLTSFALQTSPAAHGAVVIGLLPAATAAVAVLRGRELPSRLFWVASIAGAVAVVGFTVVSSGGFGGLHLSDLLLLGAVVAASVGYAEGGLLAREIGSWQVICWALVIAAPLMAVLTGVSLVAHPLALTGVGIDGWLAFAYVSAISMFLGFFAWYRGLGIGPIATVSQMQLVQPVLTIVWAALLLGEPLTAVTLGGAAVVVACAALAVRSRVTRASRP